MSFFSNLLGGTLKDPLGLYRDQSEGLGAGLGRDVVEPAKTAERAPAAAEMADRQPLAIPRDETLPAGMRNNNPGNIKYLEDVKWRGRVGPSENTDQGDPQVVFATPEMGMRAAAKLARNKYEKGLKTPLDIITAEDGWTPGNRQAAENIAKTMGISVTDDLMLDDPDRNAQFLRALITQEHGPASKKYDDGLIKKAVVESYVDDEPAKPAGVAAIDANFGESTGLDAKGEADPEADAAPQRGGGGDPEGLGLARLAPKAKTLPASDFLKTRLVGHTAEHIDGMQPDLQERLAAMFAGAPPEIADKLGIFSGYRSIERQRQLWEASDKTGRTVARPGHSQHNHGRAADLSYNGVSLAKAPAEVRKWVRDHAKEYGLTLPMSYEPWHVETIEARGGKLPEGFAVPARVSNAKSITIGADFKTTDPFGLYSGKDNPFAPKATPIADNVQPAAATSTAPAGENAQNAQPPASSGRYQEMTEDQFVAWKADWEKENRATGVVGDVWRMLKSGTASTITAAHEVAQRLPAVGEFSKLANKGVEALTGVNVDQEIQTRLNEWAEKANASVTPAQRDADQKKFFEEVQNPDGSVRIKMGAAWTDPRTYMRLGVESIPGSVVTMGPAGMMAKGAYAGAIAKGATKEVASATAAKTATIAGAISEGALGGGQSAVSVRQKIDQLPRQVVEQSEAYQALIKQGVSPDEAFTSIREDAATQAFVMAGVTTGMFGGLGDRALAKIIGEGIGGNIVKRVVAGGARGAVAEGVFEELPQGVTQQAAENLAVSRADNDQRIMEGVPEAAARGVAGGAGVGGTIGAVAGAASPAEAPAGDLPTAAQEPGPVAPGTPPTRPGGLADAVEHGQRTAPVQPRPAESRGRPPAHAATADAAAKANPNTPGVGSTVRIDEPGIEPFMARVESIVGDEAVVFDGSTGEVYQVPLSSLSKLADEGGTIAKPNREIHLDSIDTADSAKPKTPATEKPSAGSTTAADTAAASDEVASSPRPTGTNRSVGGRDATFPDDKHAALYDLGEKLRIGRGGNVSTARRDQILAAERQEVADSLGVPVEKVNEIADDYRYRVERQAKGAAGNFAANPVNPTKLAQWQRQRARTADQSDARPDASDAAGAPASPESATISTEALETAATSVAEAAAQPNPKSDPDSQPAAAWYDALDVDDRKAVLDAAKVKRSPKHAWAALTPEIRAKLDAARPTTNEIVVDINLPEAPTAAPVDAAAHEAATSPKNDRPEPTEAQQKAGNYQKGHVRIGGLDVSVENPAGSERKGTDSTGKPWSATMKSHYGYLKGTVGRDKDHIDVFVKPGTADIDDSSPVFVVDQKKAGNGHFDEHKVMIGFADEAEARAAYLENYADGWDGIRDLTATTLGAFKHWLASGDTTKPFATESGSVSQSSSVNQIPERPASGQPASKKPTQTVKEKALAKAAGRKAAEEADLTRRIGSVKEHVRADKDWGSVPGQETAKRLLEIAAVGGHKISLTGDRESIDLLTAAFPSIGGSPDLVAPGSDVTMEVPPISDADWIRPAAEKSETVRARVERAREALPKVEDRVDATVERLVADAARYFDADTIPLARALARSIAAMDGETSIRRIHFAEGLSYVPRRDYVAPRTDAQRAADDAAKFAAIDAAFAENRAVLGDFKTGDEVEFDQDGTFKNADGATSEGRTFVGTVVKIQDKDQGIVQVKGENGGDWSVGARHLRKRVAPASVDDIIAAAISTAGSKPHDLGDYPLDGRAPLGGNTKTYVLGLGRATGREHAVGFGADGKVLMHQSGTRNNTTTTPRMEKALLDPASDMAVHHNHPMSSSLSVSSDVAFLSLPGLSAIWAHGHDGTSSRAAFTPAARVLAEAIAADATKRITWYTRRVENAGIYAAFKVVFARGGVPESDIKIAQTVANNIALHRAGVTDYITTIPEHASLSDPGVQAAIEESARETARNFFGKRAGIRGYDRSAVALRHAGDVGILPEGSGGVPRQRPAEGEPAGGSGQGDRGKTGVAPDLFDFSLDEEPIKLTGNELGVEFRGPQDIGRLRRAAAEWYDKNLRGTTATMAEGATVRFTRRGMGKSTSNAKGDLILRSVPAIRSIIERGRVALDEPGNRPGIQRRLVITAPVQLGDQTLQLAVSVHQAADGRYHYDLTFDREAGGPGSGSRLAGGSEATDSGDGAASEQPGSDETRSSREGLAPGKGSLPSLEVPKAEPGNLNLVEWRADRKAPAGWDNVGDMPVDALSDADKAEIAAIVRDVAGLDDVTWTKRITIPANHPEWGNPEASTAGGFYDPVPDAITIATAGAGAGRARRVAYHEAFHRLQRLFMTPRERAVLTEELGRLRRIVGTNAARRGQEGRMSAKEIEAEAFAIYATGQAKILPHKSVRAVWDRLALIFRRIRNGLAGRGFQTAEDVFARAKAGETAARGPVSTGGAGEREFAQAPAAGTSAFTKWFGNSKVTDGNGQPQVVYHGTTAPDFANFRRGVGIGVNFGTAEAANDRAAFKGTEGARIMPVYLSIQKPFRMKDLERWTVKTLIDALSQHSPEFARAVDGMTSAKQVREFLQSQGYDGIVYRNRYEAKAADADSWIAFEPEQIKSVNNAGSFDPASSDIMYSLTENRIVEEVRGKFTDWKPVMMAAIPLQYFPELARPNMTAVAEYLRLKRTLDAYRGKKHAAADEIAQAWLKFTRLGKKKVQALADLMHQSTLAGVDPSKTDADTRAKPGYDVLRAAWTALPPKAHEIYANVREAYKAQAAELDAILLDNVRKAQEVAQRRAEAQYREEVERINAKSASKAARRDALKDAEQTYKVNAKKAEWSMKARLTKMRIAFESSRVAEPYFPLARFGSYTVSVRDVDGAVLSFSRRETAAERDRLAADMRKAYPTAKVDVGVMEDSDELRQAMDPRLVAEIEQIVGGAGIEAATANSVLDMIWQRYLETMPDLSTRKRFIHRKGTAGFDADALRAFSSHMFHSGHQMGRLKYGLELQELANEAADQARKSDDTTRGVILANELKKRHAWVMNPMGSQFAQTMTSAAFVWYLGATPAAAIANTTQTFMMGIPILAGRFGSFAKATAALLKASADSVAGYGSVGRANLSDEDRHAIEAFYESGLIDKTQSHDLAGVGDTGVNYSPGRARAMAIVSWAFHRAEVWNREVTAIAAYRMARAMGQNATDAIDTAHDLTWRTHFDYSNSNRPRFMQNDFAKVALVFRQYNINMLYRVFRDLHQSLKGETPKTRREARYQLAGVVGMMALFAGVTGVVGFNLAMAIAGAIFGDDDDPMDFEQRFRKDVLDILGPELGGVVLNGVPGHYLGIDLTSRIGMPDLWFRSPWRDLQGKDEYTFWLQQLLGATVSMGENAWIGFDLIKDGDVARGVEAMAPKPVKDLMKAWRFYNEGLANLGGNELIPAKQIDSWDIIAQAIGFTPAKVAETYDRSSALNNAEGRILRKRLKLINTFAMAVKMQDPDARKDAIEAIKAFNAVPINKPLAITADTLEKSLKARARNAAKREDGVLIANPSLSKKLRQALPERIY